MTKENEKAELELEDQEDQEVRDELETDSLELPLDEEVQNESPDLDLDLDKAKRNGYLTREEYVERHGTDKGFKSPQEFNKFGESYHEVKDAITGLKKKLDQRDKEQESLLKYIEGIKEREYERARQDVEAALREARDMGDVNQVEHLIQERSKLDNEAAQRQQEAAQREAQEALQEFTERNEWYNKDMEMTQEATQVDADIRSGKYAYKFPMPRNYRELALQVETIMNERYGNKVASSKVESQPRPVIRNTESSVNKSTVPNTQRQFKDLMKNGDYKNIYHATKRMMSKSGIDYSESDFIAQLKKDGEI